MSLKLHLNHLHTIRWKSYEICFNEQFVPTVTVNAVRNLNQITLTIKLDVTEFVWYASHMHFKSSHNSFDL